MPQQHCVLFIQDREDVVNRAREAGVAAIIVTGCTVKSAQAARDLCEAVQDFPLFFTAGVHPHNAKDCNESTLEELKQLAAHEKCVAIGKHSWVLCFDSVTASCSQQCAAAGCSRHFASHIPVTKNGCSQKPGSCSTTCLSWIWPIHNNSDKTKAVPTQLHQQLFCILPMHLCSTAVHSKATTGDHLLRCVCLSLKPLLWVLCSQESVG